jgi:hypothetical protein
MRATKPIEDKSLRREKRRQIPSRRDPLINIGLQAGGKPLLVGQPFQRLTLSWQPNHTIDEFEPASLALLLHEVPQLALHCLESVVDDLRKRGVRAIVHLLLVGDEFVMRRHGHVDPHSKLVSLLMRMIGLLDSDITAIDVVAEFFEPARFLQNELVELFRFLDATIGNIYWPLHKLTQS